MFHGDLDGPHFPPIGQSAKAALSDGTVKERMDREAGVTRRRLERGATRYDDLVGRRNFHRGLLRNGIQSKIRVGSEFPPDTPVELDY
jgi:hypothetical protein